MQCLPLSQLDALLVDKSQLEEKFEQGERQKIKLVCCTVNTVHAPCFENHNATDIRAKDGRANTQNISLPHTSWWFNNNDKGK